MHNLNMKNFDLASEAITTLQSLTKKVKRTNEKVDLDKLQNYFGRISLSLKQIPHVLFQIS
jgi:hypothetical protein